MLGWVQSVLHSAILKIPDTTVSAADKIDAIVAINKVPYLDGRLRGKCSVTDSPWSCKGYLDPERPLLSPLHRRLSFMTECCNLRPTASECHHME